MKEIISDKLQTYYIHEEVSDLLDKCTYLDPCFKARYLSDEERTQSQIKQEAEDVCISVIQESHEPEQRTTEGILAAQDERAGCYPQKDSAGEKRNEQDDSCSPQEVVQKETSRYLDLPDLDPEKDPLSWWKDEAKHFPILARLARKYLCACATSVPSERVFSI